jgi:hypothetical protein
MQRTSKQVFTGLLIATALLSVIQPEAEARCRRARRRSCCPAPCAPACCAPAPTADYDCPLFEMGPAGNGLYFYYMARWAPSPGTCGASPHGGHLPASGLAGCPSDPATQGHCISIGVALSRMAGADDVCETGYDGPVPPPFVPVGTIPWKVRRIYDGKMRTFNLYKVSKGGFTLGVGYEVDEPGPYLPLLGQITHNGRKCFSFEAIDLTMPSRQLHYDVYLSKDKLDAKE